MAAEAAVARAAACPSALTRAASAATSDLLAKTQKNNFNTASTTNTSTCQAAAAALLKLSLPEALLPPANAHLAESPNRDKLTTSPAFVHFPGLFQLPFWSRVPPP